MNILILTRSLPFHHIGGMEVVAWDVAKGLADRGHAIKIVTTACKDLAEHTTIAGIEIITISSKSGKYSKKWWRETNKLYRTHLAKTTDVVLSIGNGAYSIRALPSDPAILVMQVHGTSLDEFISKIKIKSTLSWAKSLRNIAGFWRDRRYRNFSALISIGPSVTATLKKFPTKALVGKVAIHEILNGVSPDTFRFSNIERREFRSALGIDENIKVVMSACRLHVQKGVENSIRAFSDALQSDRSMRFVIIGDGPDKSRLEGIVKELSLQDKVFFFGALKREQLPAALSAADIFIFTTSRREGLPMAPLEAAASGLPIIISNDSMPAELQAHPVNPNNIKEISAKINELALTPNSRSSLLPRANSLEDALDRYEELFSEMTVNTRVSSQENSLHDVQL